MIEILAQITAPHFVAGIVLWNDKVVEAAPIVRRALKGKSRDYVRNYCFMKNWTVSVVHQLERDRPWPKKPTRSAERSR